jgi:hypothetical protein
VSAVAPWNLLRLLCVRPSSVPSGVCWGRTSSGWARVRGWWVYVYSCLLVGSVGFGGVFDLWLGIGPGRIGGVMFAAFLEFLKEFALRLAKLAAGLLSEMFSEMLLERVGGSGGALKVA